MIGLVIDWRCRSRSVTLTATLAIACGLLTAPLAAQHDPAGGRIVAGIRVLLDGVPSADPALLKLIEVREAQPLSALEVRESIVHLMALARFDDVEVRTDASNDGLIVTFELTSRYITWRVDFRGNLCLPEAELRAVVAERFTASPPIARADEAARLVEETCRDHGYLHARVTPRVELGTRADRTVLAFDMDAGIRARLVKIAVTGVSDDEGRVLAARVGAAVGMPLDPLVARRRLSDYVESLRTKGFVEARAELQLDYAPDGTSVAGTIAVERGPLVTIEFTGDPLPPARQAEFVPVRREGSVDDDLLEDGTFRIVDYFRSQGYRDATASYRRERSGDRLRVVYDVRRGPPYRVAAVEVSGSQALAAAELRATLGTQPGAPFKQGVVDVDVAAMTERYRKLGHADVKVSATTTTERATVTGSPGVRVRFDVVEGPRTEVGEVTFDGVAGVPVALLREAVGSRPGHPFYRPQVDADREAVLVTYLDRGFQSATVEVAVTFSEDRGRADLRFTVREGPQVFVDRVIIVGNRRTSARTIERELAVRRGEPLALKALFESQRRLAALGLFRRVSVTELPYGWGRARDVLVSVEEAPATTFGYGGGLEGSRRLVRQGELTVEQFDFAPRGFFDIGRRNLWGKNRTINFFGRVSVRSRDQTSAPSDVGSVDSTRGGLGFSEYRALITFREPRVVGQESDLFVSGLAEQGYRSSFNFTRQLARAELAHRLSPTLSISGRFSVENTRLFNERFNQTDKLLIDRLFPQVRLSILSGTIARDRRDDAIDPTRGTLLSLDGDLALRSLGSEVGYARSFMQGFVYARLPGSRRIVFAGGLRLGLATGFRTTVPVLDDQGNPAVLPDGTMATVTVRNVPASERFYAGGSTTVRGYTLDRLGMPNTIDRDGFPQGGMATVIFNAELRASVLRIRNAVDVMAVGFVDIGNVFARVAEIDLGELRAGVGGGIRVRAPVVPLIRLDVGYNPSPRTFASGSRERAWAVHFGIGQAF